MQDRRESIGKRKRSSRLCRAISTDELNLELKSLTSRRSPNPPIKILLYRRLVSPKSSIGRSAPIRPMPAQRLLML